MKKLTKEDALILLEGLKIHEKFDSSYSCNMCQEIHEYINACSSDCCAFQVEGLLKIINSGTVH